MIRLIFEAPGVYGAIMVDEAVDVNGQLDLAEEYHER